MGVERDSTSTLLAKLTRWPTGGFLLFYLSMPVVAFFMEAASTFNVIALILTLALFVGNVRQIPAAELRAFHRFTAWVFFFGFLLNVAYELLHSVFYTHFTASGYTYDELVLMLFASAIADGFIVWINLFAVTLVGDGDWRWDWPWPWRNVAFTWIVSAGIQSLAETVALQNGTWAYNSAMPLIPVLKVGLTPVLQMPLLSLPTFWLAQQVTNYYG